MGDYEMIPGALHRSSVINLTTEENRGKPQLGDLLMKAVRPVIALNGLPYLQMRSLGLHSKSGREKEGKKTGGECCGKTHKYIVCQDGHVLRFKKG